MGGLVGIISRDGPQICRARVETMVRCLTTDEVYRHGTVSIEELGLYAGWTCRDGAFEDCLPVTNEKGDCLLLWAGETYPGPGERTQLKRNGHIFDVRNASYLIHQYEETGPRFVDALNGLFLGLLIDRAKGRAYLFNDRYGMKRLFISESMGDLYFASQAKAILKVVPHTRSFDPAGLSEFLTCGCTLGDRTLYHDISALPAASVLTIEGGRPIRRRRYFVCADWENQEPIGECAIEEAFRESFPTIVEKYAEADLPLGISLTGGLDTRMVMAGLDLEPYKFPCYTFGSMYRDTLDVIIARRIAEQCQQVHSTLTLDSRFLAAFEELHEQAIFRSDGYLGAQGAAALYVNRLARHLAPVRLTGNYGSELLRGVRAFRSRLPKTRFYDEAISSYLRDAISAFRLLEHQHPLSFALFHQAPSQGYGLLTIEESVVIMRTPFMDNELVRVIYQAKPRFVSGMNLSVSMIKKRKPGLLRIPTDRGGLGGGDPIMRTLRRAYSEALFKGEYWISHGMSRGTRILLQHFPWIPLEQGLLGRHKYQHFRKWFSGELSGYVKEVIYSSDQLPDCLDRCSLRRMLSDHMAGRDNYLDEIDKAMTLIISARHFFHG